MTPTEEFEADLRRLASRGCPSDEYARFERRHEARFLALAREYLERFPVARRKYTPESVAVLIKQATWKTLRRYAWDEHQPDSFRGWFFAIHRAMRRALGRESLAA